MKSDLVYFQHILECLKRIEEFTADNDKGFFLADYKTQDAVLRNLQVMAESTQKLTSELKATYPSVPWKKLSGFRNVVAHNYLGLNMERIWAVVKKEVPLLKSQVLKLTLSHSCPNLLYLLGSYLHQDFLDEFKSSEDAIAAYIASEPPSDVKTASQEINTFLSLLVYLGRPTEFLTDVAGCYYNPSADNLTLKEWLQRVQSKIAKSF